MELHLKLNFYKDKFGNFAFLIYNTINDYNFRILVFLSIS